MTIQNYYICSYNNSSDLANIQNAIFHNNSEHCNFNGTRVSRIEFIASILRDKDYIFVVETATGRLKKLADKASAIKFLKKHCDFTETEEEIFALDKIEELEHYNFYKNLKISKKDKEFLLTLPAESLYALASSYSCDSNSCYYKNVYELIFETRKWKNFSLAKDIANIPQTEEEKKIAGFIRMYCLLLDEPDNIYIINHPDE